MVSSNILSCLSNLNIDVSYDLKTRWEGAHFCVFLGQLSSPSAAHPWPYLHTANQPDQTSTFSAYFETRQKECFDCHEIFLVQLEAQVTNSLNL